jgi:anti-anti-sigma factor
MLFDARTVERGPWQLVAIVGDLDLATLPMVKSALDALDAPLVGMDLSSAAFLDAAVLGLLISARLRAERRGATFAVVCPPGPPRDLLTESRVDLILTVVPTANDLEVP